MTGGLGERSRATLELLSSLHLASISITLSIVKAFKLRRHAADAEHPPNTAGAFRLSWRDQVTSAYLLFPPSVFLSSSSTVVTQSHLQHIKH